MRKTWISSFFFALFLIFSSNRLFGTWAQIDYGDLHRPQPQQHFGYPATANLSTTWTNGESSIPSTNSSDGSKIRVILQEEDIFACGFFCNGTCTSYLFAIVLFTSYEDFPEVIWSANRDNPVSEGAILNLTAAGELVLHDVHGSIVWTTNTTRKSVAGMKLNDDGNLVLFDGHNSGVWQSFDHPTDCLVPRQKLFPGQKLITNVTSTNWTTQKDSYYLEVTNEGLFAYVGSNPPQVYYRYLVNYMNTTKKVRYVELINWGEQYFIISTRLNDWDEVGITPPFLPLYMKLMPDGHLKAFARDSSDRLIAADLLTNDDFGECSYPLACGRNSICSGNKQCGCPGTDSFKAVDNTQPNRGCFPVTPLTCNANATQDQHFIQLKNVKYFTYTADMEDVDMETCKQACLKNCSCKAAIFKYYGSNSSSGSCNLPSELFTMTSIDAVVLPYNSSTFIKVQNGRSSASPRTPTPATKRKNKITKVLGSIVGSLVLLLIVVVGFTKYIVQKQKMDSEIEEEYLDKLPGLPTRFTYEELKTTTKNFSKKLGEGGFGSVFEGTLEDGSRIAVKCLQGLVHVKKSFLAEVESIGSIHHVNLVQLRGFCAWRSERLLVYEFMSNGSLDQWIYYGERKHVLGWVCRKKIILDIAKGLAYLHEECRQKIIHLDIKPQNILLDENFNAKVSDFGLAKLMDRNQSQVISMMRGTPGYMAPEWLSSIITEKMDVYSFGILLLEILCGRKNFDRSQPEESWHLLRVFQSCWEQGTLLSIVDRYSEDMHVHGIEVLEKMKVASWCLQTYFSKRPSMSIVIKVLEGVMDVESNLDCNFSDPRVPKTTIEPEKSSKPMLPSFLSGPR